ncbi:MAG: SRPBCC family protein [bacterium]
MPEITFIDQSWTINAPAPEVFGCLQEVEQWPEWASKIKSASRSGTGALSPGETIQFVPDFILPLPLSATVGSVEEPRRISWGVSVPGFTIEHRFDIRADGQSCEISQFESARGLLAPTSFPFKSMLYELDQQWGDDLADHLR